MSMPYENASSGQKALADIQKVLRAFGCTKFSTGEDFENGEVYVQFEHRGRWVSLRASTTGYAAAWLRQNPWSRRRRTTRQQHEAKAMEIAGIGVYSMLRDWVKGQVTAIECGILSFEAAFMPHMMLPSGKRVVDEIAERGLLPAPKDTP